MLTLEEVSLIYLEGLKMCVCPGRQEEGGAGVAGHCESLDGTLSSGRAATADPFLQHFVIFPPFSQGLC